MRSIGSYYVRLEGGASPFHAVKNAVSADGWRLNGSHSEDGVEICEFDSDRTPLVLSVIRYDRQPQIFQLLFVEKWLRCSLAGGWFKIGQMPDDITGRVINRLQVDGWSVELEVE